MGNKRSLIYSLVFGLFGVIVVVSGLYGVQWLYDLFSGTGLNFYGYHVHHGMFGLVLASVGLFGFWHFNNDEENEGLKHICAILAIFGILLMAHDFFVFGDTPLDWVLGLA